MKILSLITILIFGLTTIISSQEFERKAKEAEGLEIGTKAPDFNAPDQQENDYSLSRALENGPVVMIFYRGHWCPVCNRHLGKLEEGLGKITETGASVIAVSPEKPGYIEKTIKKTGASYTMLYDADYQISNAYDVTFLPSGITRLMYSTALGADFSNTYPGGSKKLPIPATYIIDSNGVIIWRHFNPDYKERATVEQIVKALKKPNKG
jgi:peroxiredoxin